MKSRLANAPLRNMLRLVVLTTSVVSLLVACGVLFTVQFYFFKTEFLRSVSLLAEMMARNCASAISLNDCGDAEAVIAEQLAQSNVRNARILLPDGSEFGIREIPDNGLRLFQSPPGRLSSWWEGSDFIQAQPVTQNHAPIATLFVMADYRTQARSLITLYLPFISASSAGALP